MICERSYYVESTLFPADDAEQAYRTALGWLPSFDYTYGTYPDGPGDIAKLSAIGIHDLEEITPLASGLASALGELYGVEVGRYDPKAVDADGVPLVRSRDDLEVFRRPGAGRDRAKPPESRG